MINEHLDRTIATLMSDADFLSDFPEKLRSFNDQDKTIEDQKAMIKRAAVLILHIIDYCVTSSVIDMDADISRYCQRYPAEAKKFREKLNMAGLSLKENYQYLFKDGTVYTEKIAMFSFIYSLFLGISIDIRHGADVNQITPPPFGYLFMDYTEFEFISAVDDTVLEKKFQLSKDLNFTLDSVKEFIDNCFKWSDKIQECLERSFSMRTTINIAPEKLYRLHDYCNAVAYTNTTPEKFAKALMGYSIPDFHVIHHDFFYSVVYALYLALGPLCPRDPWLRDTLARFELPDKDYYNAKSRIVGDRQNTTKIKKRFLEIQGILEK